MVRQVACVVGVVLCWVALAGADDGLVAYWSFDQAEGRAVPELVSGVQDSVLGNFRYVDGVSGRCIKFDEFTTAIVRRAEAAPKLGGGGFTVEAWIAPRAFPWNWCPIVMQRDDKECGFYFGIDAEGRFGLGVCVDGKWVQCNSPSPIPGLEPEMIWREDHWVGSDGKEVPGPVRVDKQPKAVIPLLKWSHLLGTFDEKKGIAVYLNGKLQASCDVKGEYCPADGADLRIGRDTRKLRPAHTERPYGTLPCNYSFDGLIDEVRIYEHSFNESDVKAAYGRVRPAVAQPLQFRRIPTGPKNTGTFGAYYTYLKYDEDYDRQFRMGPDADVVVTFDEYPFRLTYWHGINYYPIWWSENDIGLMHEAAETHGPVGCQEAMMDRQCRYSHVRIVENTEARVVIHWRNALSNILYGLACEDPNTGWGDWCDDYYTIYPDGVAARKVTLYSSCLEKWHSFEQDNFILQPGLSPPDILEKEAGILANLKGDESKLSWAGGNPEGKMVKDPVIIVYNIKAKSKPFMVTYPGQGRPTVEGKGMPWPYCYLWWNHWPASQIPCDGRQVWVVDGRPSSSCIGEAAFEGAFERGENMVSQVMLFGMVMDVGAAELVPLARSWARPAKFKLESPGCYKSEGYDPTQRAYILSCNEASNPGPLKFVLKATKESPVVNAAFVVRDWGRDGASLEVNGRAVERGKDFRYGHRDTLTGSDLIVWVDCEGQGDVEFVITPEK